MNTPKMTPGTVEMVSVEWIMQNATHSVDGYDTSGYSESPTVEYAAMLLHKTADSWFPDLVRTIVERGFRVPIVLVSGYKGPGTIAHGNGHHRMCAAILLALNEIPVYWSEWERDYDYMCLDASESDDELLDGADYDDAWHVHL